MVHPRLLKPVRATPDTQFHEVSRALEHRDAVQGSSFSVRVLADVAIEVTSDDPSLDPELALTLGARTAGARRVLSIVLASGPEEAGSALATFHAEDDTAFTVDDLLLALETPDFPFRLVASEEPGWTSFAWRNERETLFSFRERHCRIRKRSGWQRALSILILHRVFRLRSDAIFFHAAAVGICGRGVLIVGPKGRGKSTTALALASRGHLLLGDETAGYVPERRELIPVLRPVGIKSGPRARAIDNALGVEGTRGEPVLRLDIERVLPGGPEPRPVPLFAVVFLDPFEARPALAEIDASTADIARLQPVSSSLVNALKARRVFELGRMLALARVFRLAPGDPDETATLVERTIGGLPS